VLIDPARRGVDHAGVPAPADTSPTPLPDAAREAASILVYGGTFDPPHRAHVELPALVRDRLGVDLLLYVPASISPFKQDVKSTPAEHRLAMLRLALRDTSRTAIWTVELDDPGVHYTVDTLAQLRSRVADDVTLYLLVGADQAREFHRWRAARRIFELAQPAVMMRPPETRASLRAALTEQWSAEEVERLLSAVVAVPELDISATEVRARLAHGEDVRDALPDAVTEYIAARRLYEC
jgi:nicotinate-nucleotide adenylyltransferase